MIAFICSQRPPSGAKAQRIFWRFCGTTEVVPCYKAMLHSSLMLQMLHSSSIMSNEILGYMEGIFA
jgi:hypothetical protein